MNIEDILKKLGMEFKINKEKNKYEWIELENESIVVIIKNKGNVFKIDRKFFYKIDDLLLPYIFILIDTNSGKKYCMKIKEPNNFLRNAFENSSKDEIYFGKQVLQNEMEDKKILDEIKKIGE